VTVKKGRIDRGWETQHIVKRWCQAHGWPYAEAVGNGRDGTDVTGLPGLLCETKAWATWQPTTWLRQHQQTALYGDPPLLRPTPLLFVVQRPNGYGERNVAEWPAIMRLDRLTWLLREAGYGDRP
jgi:hypothetical protein